MKTFNELISDSLQHIEEIFPWDLEGILESNNIPLLLDIREPDEFKALHIKGSFNVPRGILEQSCEYGYHETVAKLVNARDQDVVVICRSGNRSVLAAHTMQLMGYKSVKSLKTGLKGWNDAELALQDIQEQTVDIDYAEQILTPPVAAFQK
ncbi:rhodanese-like domain-containing protein [Candidatus Marithrix sp. Canyon 246]|uniref:rhodanese-like domain-containing protein n=1 Tax=Candidatus Marithrix sp. Canyon 246 TaxID=1827136 RepID=UPI000849EFCE|nr:rhodanese-like domain-containing protein [Candidatus Marithrix sp. Canyon 246]